MNLLLLIFAVFKAGLPLPKFSDAADVQNWLGSLNEPLSELIAAMVSQFTATGRIVIDLPDGPLVLADSGRCLAVDPSKAAERIAAAGVAADPAAWGDGKFLEILKMLLPIILQILPLFLEPEPGPDPQPEPQPPVV